jgi:hypothetical protein
MEIKMLQAIWKIGRSIIRDVHPMDDWKMGISNSRLSTKRAPTSQLFQWIKASARPALSF